MEGQGVGSAHSAKVGGYLSSGTEGRIEAAIGVIPRQGEVCIADKWTGGARYDDLAIGLKGEGPPGGRRHLPAAAKGWIEAAIWVISRQGRSRHDDLAVGLQGQSKGLINTAEVGGHLAVDAEGRIEATIRVVACEREVTVARGKGPSYRDDLAVCLKPDGRRQIIAAKVSGHDTPRAEGGIERPVRVVAHEGEVAPAPDCSTPGSCRHDLAVLLKRKSIRSGRAEDACFHFPAATEGRIQAPVGVVARQGEVTGPSGSGHDDFAVGLKGKSAGRAMEAEIGGNLPPAAKGGVEIARRGWGGGWHAQHE